MKINKKIAILSIISQITVYVGFNIWFTAFENPMIRILWLLQNVFIVVGFFFLAFRSPVEKRNTAEGRIIAVVAAYNETEDSVNKTIESLLNQSVIIDEIHVIDDGSKVPMKRYEHPRVFCHWQINGGKRHAQAAVLRKIDPSSVDFILTVDSDSALDYRATEMLLRAMSNPKVKACTGTIFASNYSRNLLTKLQELNYGLGATIKASRRMNGVLDSTSGACSLYRAEIIFYHLDDYVSSGTNGDDRRLCIYSLLEGDVIYVPEAIVSTEVPEKIKELWRQRIRWGKSGWQAMPVFFTNFSFRKSFFYGYTLVMSSLIPILYIFLILFFMKATDAIFIWLGYYFVNSYIRTSMYMSSRLFWTKKEKIANWLLYSLLILPFQLFVSITKYAALFKLKNRSWETRG